MHAVPHKIFYTWFGGKKSTMANICIQNWREKMPDYEIIEINEKSPYFDFQQAYDTCQWFKTVYDRKMWAFVADYARCKVLYEYGGIYLDTDVTLCKSLEMLQKEDFYCAEEKPGLINAAVLVCKPKHKLLHDMLDFYQKEIYKSPLYTIPDILTYLIEKNNYKNIKIFPREYFYPYYPFAPYNEDFTPECITANTYAVHWWSASWVNEENQLFLTTKHLPTAAYRRVSYKLFSFFSLYSKKQKNGKTVYSCLGIPLLTVQKKADAQITKYYVLGILIFKAKKQR